MASFEVKLKDNTDKYLRRLDRASEAVRKAAFDVEANAKSAIMSGKKSGRRYGRHTASAAGEAPATDTGKLVNSIQAKSESKFVWIIGVGSKHGKALELGTRRMGARPFLLPALHKVEKSFRLALEAIFRD